MELDHLIEMCYENAKEHGFWDDINKNDRLVFEEKLLLLHSEISEVFEEIRAGKTIHELYYNSEPGKENKPEGIEIELADLAIRLFDMCGFYKIDLLSAIILKHTYNKTRSHKHGKQC